MLYKDGGIVDKILSVGDYYRSKRFLRAIKKYIGKSDCLKSSWGIKHNGRLYHVKIEQVE